MPDPLDAPTKPQPTTDRRQRVRRRRGQPRSAAPAIFLTPWLIGLLVLTLGPMAASLYLSLTDFDLLTAPRFVGLKNYVTLFTDDPQYLKSLQVTATYVLVSVPLTLAFALLVALALNGKRTGVGGYRAVYYLPSLLGGSVAISILWQQIFGGNGVINKFLAAAFGIEGPAWVSDPRYALWTIILLHVWQFGAPMIIFLAGLKQIPQDLYDSASVDGATAIGKFLNITLPLMTPLIFFNLVLQIINSFQAFTPAFIVSGGSGGPAESLLFYTLLLYQEAFTNFNMGYASAMAWVLLIIVAALTAVSFATSRYWVYYEDEGLS